MAFIENALVLAAVGFVGAFGLTLIGAITQGRQAFAGFWRFALGFALLGVLAATPSLLTGQRWAFLMDNCPRATAGGSSCY